MSAQPAAQGTQGGLKNIKDKMNALREEADRNAQEATELKDKNKELESTLLQREQDLASALHKVDVAEADVQKLESKLSEAKTANDAGLAHTETIDGLLRKISILEDELDKSEKQVSDLTGKLRELDVRTEHFERQSKVQEEHCAKLEKELERTTKKLNESQQEIDDLVNQMGSI